MFAVQPTSGEDRAKKTQRQLQLTCRYG